MRHYDIIIIGGGPAGLTAAVYARRAGKSVLLLEKESMGGQIASSPKVDNFPTAPGVSGLELANRLYAQAEELGAAIELEEALEIRPGTPKTVVTDYGSYTAQAVILATGMVHRSLGLPGEDSLSGISYCAVCDGAFYKGRAVAVCGGGNSALQEALYLSEICSHVTLIHRRDSFRADSILVEALHSRSNISLLTDSVIKGLQGRDSALTALEIANTATGSDQTLAVDGLFVAIGYLPQTAIASPLSILNAQGFVDAGESCLTAQSGIFAAGDCRAKSVRQMLTACADGAIAALAACTYCQ